MTGVIALRLNALEPRELRYFSPFLVSLTNQNGGLPAQNMINMK